MTGQPTRPHISVVDVPARDRFEASVDGVTAGFIGYQRQPDRLVLVHTEVDPSFEGRGVGSALARGALGAVRAAGDRVEAVCPFIAAYLRRHPEDADLIVPPDGNMGTDSVGSDAEGR